MPTGSDYTPPPSPEMLRIYRMSEKERVELFQIYDAAVQRAKPLQLESPMSRWSHSRLLIRIGSLLMRLDDHNSDQACEDNIRAELAPVMAELTARTVG